MAGENAAGTAGKDAKADAGQMQKRERSAIAFPYNSLNDAVELAKAIHDNVGLGGCDDDQLAAWLKQSVKSSGFRVQLSAARMFGVIDATAPKNTLSELGRQIVDPKQEREAKAKAFLNVPLFAAVYNKYRGGLMPPAAALERDMVGLGVAEKQKDRARQVLERSAEQAGYFEHGKNRLIMPGVAARDDAGGGERKEDEYNGGGGGGGKPPRHPLIEGLVQSLPSEQEGWTLDDAAHWLQAAAFNFRYVYKLKGTISVKAEGESK